MAGERHWGGKAQHKGWGHRTNLDLIDVVVVDGVKMLIVFQVPHFVDLVSSGISEDFAVDVVKLDEPRIAQRFTFEQRESSSSILAADVLERR